ncbi:MAG: hypothetical protein J0L91_11695 [Burkholderiales bacterium]|nr:hypothetical protein [Burkholderiales bacterium]
MARTAKKTARKTSKATAKKRPVGKTTAKTTAKKRASVKTARRKPLKKAARAAKSPASPIGIGDVVLFTSDGHVVGPGRVCQDGLEFDQLCVMFPEIGCQRVDRMNLRLAPAGSTAPACDGCDDC